MRQILVLTFATALFASCSNEKPVDSVKATTVKVDTVTYSYDSAVVYSKNVIKTENRFDTTKAGISYPVFKNDTLNLIIQRKVTDYIAQEEQTASYQSLANSFVKGYDDFFTENNDRTQAWFLMIKLRVIHQASNYIGIEYLHSDYTGGAHPNTAFSYINYNPKTNQTITLDSLITDKAKLRLIAETIFRKEEKLSPTAPLAGKYFFDNGEFILAQNFYISKKGLVFLYNPYEIKAYVYGTTAITIPFAKLKEIAKPNTVLTAIN